MDLLAHMLAAGGGDDQSLKFWFWLIVGIVFIIKKVVDSLKGKIEDNQEKTSQETEGEHEKRVKEIMADMRRSVPPKADPRPQPSRRQPPARSMRPAPVERPHPFVPRTPPPKAEQAPGWNAQAQDAAKNTLEHYVKATEEARASLNSLSDAEQAALDSLRQETAPSRTGLPLSAHVPESLSLKHALRHPQSLKTAILYQEILGKPKALRGVSFSGN